MADEIRPKRVFKLPPLPPLKPVSPYADFVSRGEAAGVEVSASGLGALEQNIKNLGPIAMDAAGRKMEQIAGEIITDAKENGYVPEDTGDLKDSGDWDEYNQVGRVNNPTITEIKMWFGAPLTARALRETAVLSKTQGLKVHDPNKYALDQHENFSYVHPRGGGPKYLEIPFTKREPTIMAEIAAAVDEAFGGGNSQFGYDINLADSQLNQYGASKPGYGGKP